jgi:rSAM/selenodomain-associated transferase 2
VDKQISIIIPVLNEAPILEEALSRLQGYREKGHEIIVVDGGSRDGSMRIASRLADRVLISGAGRAMQMNTGAENASRPILLFLHADTLLPEDADQLIAASFSRTPDTWGRFDLRLSGKHKLLRIVEWSINWRTAITGVATGDQAIFVSRNTFDRVGAFDDYPLMEDVALSKKLRSRSWPCRVRNPVSTSSRKWEEEGVLKTIMLMWFLRSAFFLGVHPARLVRYYYRDKVAS